ncbi:MAG TPA: type II toxin-antitoxin system HicB family antitoxin [Bacilli bacterium]|nr:type II toxin-antitoxin system HicB family antitoxin [Bacilli bacterium]
MKKDRYMFSAIFDFAEDGISIEFPDLPGCLPSAHSSEEAMKNAKEALALHLYSMEQDSEAIPEPTDFSTLRIEPNQVIVMIEVWMPPYRDEIEEKAVNKTLTIPKWLDDLAKERKVNFSRILQDALKNYLGVTDKKKDAI